MLSMSLKRITGNNTEVACITRLRSKMYPSTPTHCIRLTPFEQVASLIPHSSPNICNLATTKSCSQISFAQIQRETAVLTRRISRWQFPQQQQLKNPPPPLIMQILSNSEPVQENRFTLSCITRRTQLIQLHEFSSSLPLLQGGDRG